MTTETLRDMANYAQFAIGIMPKDRIKYLTEFLAAKGAMTADFAVVVEKIHNGTDTWRDYAYLSSDGFIALGSLLSVTGDKRTYIIGQSLVKFGKAINVIAGVSGWKEMITNMLDQPIPTINDLRDMLVDDPNGGISQDLADYILQTNRYNDSISIQIYDPLILDLNGNGKIDLTSTSNGVHFDHDANDISFKSSWVDKEDGLLVYDRNNNGIIDNGTELFGNFTRIASANTNSSSYENIDDANKNNNNLQTNNTTLAKHGYEALANLDSNNDGVIDINDKDFNKLRIWQDINKDGVSQTNELKTLDELNIKSLNLNYNEVNQDLRDNNTLTLKGSYTKTNGTAQAMDISQTTKKLIKETIWTTSIARMLG